MAVAQARARDDVVDEKLDPALDPVEQITAQMRRMIESMSEFTVARLTKLRDRVDDVMHQHKARQEQLLEDVRRYGEDCAHTIDCEKVMSDALDNMVEQLGQRRVSTVTQLPRRS